MLDVTRDSAQGVRRRSKLWIASTFAFFCNQTL
jgi:hypothetical protein